jgi:transcriptional regulator with XRE-family HTH domain
MNNLTYIEIAEKMKVSRCAAFRWLNGERSPTPKNAERLEKITGVPTMAWLFPEKYPNPYVKKENKE